MCSVQLALSKVLFVFFYIGMSHRPLPDTPGAPGTMSNRWQSLESVNSIESCDPHSFIALYDFKGDDDDQLSIKANQEVGVQTYIFRVLVKSDLMSGNLGFLTQGMLREWVKSHEPSIFATGTSESSSER